MPHHPPTFQNACNAIVVSVCVVIVILFYYEALSKEQPSHQPTPTQVTRQETRPEKVEPQPVLSEHEKNTAREDELYWEQLKNNKTHADGSIKIHSSLPDLHFSIFGKYKSYKSDSGDYTYSYITPSHFEYSFGNTDRPKRMNLKGKMFSGAINRDRPIIEFVDINFDGYLDLRIFDNAGNFMYWYQTFLFDPKKKEFVHSKQLSALAMPVIDSKNKRIYSRYREGSCDENANRYVIRNDRLYLEKAAIMRQGFLLDNERLILSGNPAVIHLI